MKANNGVTIGPGTRIKVLLNADREQVIDQLVKLNRNFSKLRNSILRNLFAGRVTIAEACGIADCKVSDFLKSMEEIGFVISDDAVTEPLADSKIKPIDFSRSAAETELDVRPYIEKSQDPLKIIMSAIKKLEPQERLKILNTFKPTPLINLLSEKGFSSHTEFKEDNLVITWFEKTDNSINPEELPAAPEPAQHSQFDEVVNRYEKDHIRYIDVRHLETPQPMLAIIENIETLPEKDLLYIHHKKIPVFLLPELEKRGLTYLFNPTTGTEVDMLIYKL